MIKKPEIKSRKSFNQVNTSTMLSTSQGADNGVAGYLGGGVSEWKTLTIPEFAEVISGSTPATNIPEYWDGDIEWVTPVDLSRLLTRQLIKRKMV